MTYCLGPPWGGPGLFNLREFGFKLSVIAAPLREASLAAKRGNVVGVSRK